MSRQADPCPQHSTRRRDRGIALLIDNGGMLRRMVLAACLMLTLFASLSASVPARDLSQLIVESVSVIGTAVSAGFDAVQKNAPGARTPAVTVLISQLEQLRVLDERWVRLGETYGDFQHVADANRLLIRSIQTPLEDMKTQISEERDSLTELSGPLNRLGVAGDQLQKVAMLSAHAVMDGDRSRQRGYNVVRLTRLEQMTIVEALEHRFPGALAANQETLTDRVAAVLLEFYRTAGLETP